MRTVIGGGLAGLAAAIELARHGEKVRLLEQHQELGGRAVTSDKDGFSLNLGPHAVYLDGAMHKSLQEWGVMPSGGRPVLAGDRVSMVIGGKRHPFVRDLASLVTCSFMSPLERIEAGRMWSKLAASAPATGVTMAQWLDREVSSPVVRHFVEALIRLSTYCGQPELQSADAVLAQLALGRAGVTYVDHGWRTIIRNMVDYARSLGVRIEAGAHGEGQGILAVSPQEVEHLTGRNFALTPIRMAALDLALDELPPGAAAFALGLDQPLYYSVHSEFAKVAPAGKATVHVAKYLGASESNPGCDRRHLERFADLLMPGWRDRVHYVRFLPEMTVSHAVTGLAPRPGVDALGLDGVRIAGDWVGPEGMLADAAFASGLRAARSLLR